MSRLEEPLRGVGSLRLKLGLLVSVSVLVAAVLATLGAAAVPAWLSVPVTVVLALGVTQWLAHGMTAPLRQMTEAARRMAGGDHAVAVDTSARDEVGELARAFSAMAAELADVDRQRRELIGSVSHELRTPLAALTALLENLHDGVTRPDAATLAPALLQARRLGSLVEDLLDLSRVEGGVTPLRRSEVALEPLLRLAASEADALGRASSRGVTVEVGVEPEGLSVLADPDRLHQLVANLLDNAVRHAAAEGTVTVRAERRDDAVVIDVADDGPGIAPGDRQRVFERFGTADAQPRGTGADASGAGGTGLGLAIARWVADLHGGRIAVVDPPSGRGALLRVELPAQPAGHSSARSSTQSSVQSSGSPRTAVDASVRPSTGSRTAPLVLAAPGGPGAPAGTAAPEPGAVGPRGLADAAAGSGDVAGRPPEAGHRPGTADDVFGSWWPDRAPASPRVLLAGLAIGVLAAAVLPERDLGLGATLVLLVAGVTVWSLSARRRTPHVVASAAVCAGLALVPVLRDAEWIAVLGVLAAGVVVPTALLDPRSVRGVVVAVAAWPLAGLRGLPWAGRCVRALTGPGQGVAVARTALASLVAALVFGLLFASADAVFGRWFADLAPDTGDLLVARVFTAVAVAGVVLAAAYLALSPPRGEGAREERDGARARARRYEWLVPLLVVDLVFAVFLAAQVAAVAGGAAYVESLTGFTYAAYAREGFVQLTLATALTLVVLALAGRGARRQDPRDRAWLRGAAGVLCVLTLLVVASAMSRMWLYTEAYGLTRLRLLVWVFEGWLALVVVALVLAGIRLRGWWVPRAAVLSGAAALLALALANPDGVVARVNVERFASTGSLDTTYLAGLSDDAVPALLELPDDVLACAVPGSGRGRPDGGAEASATGWAALNLGRLRAAELLRERPGATSLGCGLPPEQVPE